MNHKSVPKVFTVIEPRITQLTLPTEHRDSFLRFLDGRKIKLEKPVQTEVWQGVESSLTEFILPVSVQMAHLLFDDWLGEQP